MLAITVFQKHQNFLQKLCGDFGRRLNKSCAAGCRIIEIHINFIGPMFNKYESLNSVKYKKLISDIRCLCNNDSKFPIDKIYVVDQSKRTGHSNAMITGFGNHQSIIIFDNLLIKKKPKKEEVEEKKESLSKDQQK